LAEVVRSWPDLSEHIRAAIKALVSSVIGAHPKDKCDAD